jgi:hypothetical protein
MKEIVITGDTNDGDYVTEITEISDEEIIRIKEILNKMPKKGYFIRYKTEEMGTDDQENSDYQHITYEEKQFLGRFLPYGDSNYPGIHTIEDVYIVEQLEDIL